MTSTSWLLNDQLLPFEVELGYGAGFISNPTRYADSPPALSLSTQSSVTASPVNRDTIPDTLVTLDDLKVPEPGQDPGYPVHKLIQYAIQSSPSGKLLLAEICKAIEMKFPSWYSVPDRKKGLYCSVRHHLTWYPKFVTAGKPSDVRGKSRWWAVDPSKLHISPKKKSRKRHNPRLSPNDCPVDDAQEAEATPSEPPKHQLSSGTTPTSRPIPSSSDDILRQYLNNQPDPSFVVAPQPTVHSSFHYNSTPNAFGISPVPYQQNFAPQPHSLAMQPSSYIPTTSIPRTELSPFQLGRTSSISSDDTFYSSDFNSINEGTWGTKQLPYHSHSSLHAAEVPQLAGNYTSAPNLSQGPTSNHVFDSYRFV
ncbi:hypothetical protein FRC03_008400 [Tulasnella sp. 419]|nr:hypothetical protein FRC03_008400 [Tulasnella sp. 419]